MRTTKSAVAVGVVVLMLASGMSFAGTIYSWDGGTSGGGIAWNEIHSCEYAMNIFPTRPSNNVIHQLQVAWGNLLPDSPVVVGLYAIATMPDPTKELPNQLNLSGTLLASVSTTVPSGQANGAGLTFDGNWSSGWLDSGNNLVTITNPVWSSYNINPTTVSTPYFGVYVGSNTCGLPDPQTGLTQTVALLDWKPNCDPKLGDILPPAGGTDVPGALISCINSSGFNPDKSSTLQTDWSSLVRPDWVGNYGWAGYVNNPFLIRADGVPMGDATLDGTVGIDDFSVLLAHWGSSSTNWSDGNFIGAGNIGIDDFSILLSQWGAGSGSDFASMQAPEPATLSLLALGGLALLRRSRR